MGKKIKSFIWIFVLALSLANNGCGTAGQTSIVEETKETPIAEEYSESVDCIWDSNVLAWVDQNGNGKRDETDTPLEDVEFQVNDTLNHLKDVSEPAISDGHGRAKLSVWLPGCPDTNLEVYAKPPDGYKNITDSVIKVDESQNSNKEVLDFGFTLVTGYPSPTAYVAGLTCKSYSESANDFTVDSHGVVWLVNNTGIKTFQASTNSWKSFYSRGYILGKQISVSQNDVVWINEPLFQTMRFEDGESTSYSAENDPIAQSFPSIGTTSDGFVWFHKEYGNLLAGYNPETNSWKSFLSQNGNTPAIPTWSFTDGDTWRATFADMSLIQPPKSQSDGWNFYPRYIFSKTEIIDNPIAGVGSKADVDWQGKVWLATNNGIAQYDSTSNTWRVFELTTQLFDYFSEIVIANLSTSPDGSIWIAVEGEHPLLFRFTSNTSNLGEWRKFDFRDGIPDIPDLTTIEFDPEGNIWIGFGNQPKIARCSEIKP